MKLSTLVLNACVEETFVTIKMCVLHKMSTYVYWLHVCSRITYPYKIATLNSQTWCLVHVMSKHLLLLAYVYSN